MTYLEPNQQNKQPLELDDLIVNIVKHFGYIRRKKLHQEVEKYYKSDENDKIKKIKRPNKSTKTSKPINKQLKISQLRLVRAINRLQKLEQVKILKYNEIEKFGINEKDKRSTYITLYSIANSVPFYDKVFSLIKKGNERERKNALIEIESLMKNVVLTPNQLDEILGFLDKKNLDLGSNILRIIEESINNKLIFPSKIDKFRETLINFYEKVLFNKTKKRADGSRAETYLLNMKAKIIRILGILNDDVIIKWLKEDVKQNKDANLLSEEGYVFWSVSKIIDEHKEDLFNFQNSLDESQSKTIFQIRSEAQNNIPTYESNYSKFREKLEFS